CKQGGREMDQFYSSHDQAGGKPCDIADEATTQGDETGGMRPAAMRTCLVEYGESGLYQLGLFRSVERNQQAGNAHLAHLLVDRLNQRLWQAGIDDQGEVISMQVCESLPELRPIRASPHLNRVFVGNARSCPLLCLEAKQISLLAFHQGLHT